MSNRQTILIKKSFIKDNNFKLNHLKSGIDHTQNTFDTNSKISCLIIAGLYFHNLKLYYYFELENNNNKIIHTVRKEVIFLEFAFH